MQSKASLQIIFTAKMEQAQLLKIYNELYKYH